MNRSHQPSQQPSSPVVEPNRIARVEFGYVDRPFILREIARPRRYATSHQRLTGSTLSRSLVTVCMLACLCVSATTAHGQLTLPAAENGKAPPKSPSIQSHLKAIDTALGADDFTAAVQAYRAARQIDPQNAELHRRYDYLVRRGIDGSLLNLTPATAKPSLGSVQSDSEKKTADPSANSPAAAPDANPQSWPLQRRQQEARRLTAMGRTALDRGDVRSAYQCAIAAQGMGLAQHEFNPGDTRPWQLLLDVQSAARRSGVDLNQIAQGQSAATPPGTIAPTSDVMPIGQTGQSGTSQGSMVAQAGGTYTPEDSSGVQQVQAVTEDASEGEKLFASGMKFLSTGKQAEARDEFVKAWEFEAELPVDTRRALQDKLTLLQPSRMPANNEPAADLTPIQKADLAAAQQVKRLYREVTTELATANEKKTSDPLAAVEDLERLARKVEGANIDESSRAALTAMVSRALSEQNAYVEANRAKIDLDLRNERIRTEMDTEAAREARIDEEISLLVDSFNDLMDQKRYQEAEVIAKQVGELKPDSSIAMTMFHNSRTQVRLQMDEEIRAGSEDAFNRTMLDIGRTAIAQDPDRPYLLPEARDWEALSRRRLADNDSSPRLSFREQQIKQQLKSDVELKYNDTPLGEVLDDLSAVTGVPIVIDQRALSALRITRDTPVTKNVSSRVALKSALNILLEDLDLTYVLQNDVLNVTSREARRTMTRTHTYRVADLVTPIPNFISGYEHGLAGALKASYQMIRPTTDVQVVPVSMTDLGGGMANNSANNLGKNMLGQYNPMGSGAGFTGGLGVSGAAQAGRGGGSMADFDSLMTLIQQTIEPDSWEALGGVGTMAPYPQNLSLVVSTTSDVHDQIVDLLESLRRLQNLQITIEVRFITLADTFFEQIGIDFDVRFDDNANQIPADDAGPSVTIGLDAQGTPTADLDIRFDQDTIGAAPPPFGASAGGAGISSIGFAILSDIEAFFFLQAAQGDSRSNIMQAPKVTLFDGQIASINDTVSRPFVTSIVPVVGDFAVAQQPVIVVLDEGTRLNVQGVVSDDKRFVRLTLVPTFSQIGEVNTFTYEGSRTTRRSSSSKVDTNGDGVINEDDEDEEEDVIQGTTVQQPTFASTSVSTTVSVPDGGTILLGGIKRMSEGRNESGVPFLSKIPYVSRLFRNTGVGRTSTSLMLMVTPRIIIQEEEEQAQTGFVSGN